MFIKVLKLLVKSRFSRSFLLIVFFIFIYSLFTISFGLGTDTPDNFGSYYLAFIFLLFLISATVAGGLSLTAADRDFLLTSPVKNITLIPAFFISQALASSLIFVAAASGALIDFRTDQLGLLAGILAIVCMAILPISMSLNMAGKNIYIKVGFAGVEATWVVSSFFGFPYGALSFINGSGVDSSIGVILVTVVATAVASQTIRAESLPFRISSFSSRNRNSYRKTYSFTDTSVTGTILKLNFRQVDFTSRAASMGNIRVRINRVSIYMMFIIMSVLASIFTSLIIVYQKTFFGFFGSFGVYLSSVYITWFLSLMLSTGTLSKERAWLSFTSIPIENYLKKVLYAKMLQTLFVSVPFVISSLILGIYVSGTYFTLTVILLFFPAIFSGINFSLSFIRKPYQILQEDLLPSTYNASQFAIFPISMTMLGILFAITIFPVTIIPAFIGSAAFLYILIRNRNYWQKRLYYWVEMGYQ